MIEVTNDLRNSDAFGVTLACEALLEDLTNWYVRRSRRRFWKGEHDEEKDEAYVTLYHVLVKFVRLLAPLVPFVTEVMYQNLVRSVQPAARASVHHTDWPRANTTVIDDSLLEQMALARRITSLGLSARSRANLRVRQPLARCLVHVAEGRQDLTADLAEIVAGELNVKALDFVDEPGKLVIYRILPNNPLLGPRFGREFPKVRAALAELDPDAVARQVNAGEYLELALDAEMVELAPEEILIHTDPAEGLTVAADRVLTVAIDATLTPELKAEGMAREVVRRIQTMRKNADFEIADHITTWYSTPSSELNQVMEDWGAYIQMETLSDRLVDDDPPPHAYVEQHKLDGIALQLGVRRNT